jgi:hypothetical protein
VRLAEAAGRLLHDLAGEDARAIACRQAMFVIRFYTEPDPTKESPFHRAGHKPQEPFVLTNRTPILPSTLVKPMPEREWLADEKRLDS